MKRIEGSGIEALGLIWVICPRPEVDRELKAWKLPMNRGIGTHTVPSIPKECFENYALSGGLGDHREAFGLSSKLPKTTHGHSSHGCGRWTSAPKGGR